MVETEVSQYKEGGGLMWLEDSFESVTLDDWEGG